MPSYHVESPDGKTITMEGDHPPSEADITSAFQAITDKQVSGVKIDPYQQIQMSGKSGAMEEGGSDFLKSVANDPVGFLKSLPDAAFTLAAMPGKTAYLTAADVLSKAFNQPEYGGNLETPGYKELPADVMISGAAKTNPKLALATKLAEAAPELASMMVVNPSGTAGRLIAAGFSADMVAKAKPMFEEYAAEINKPKDEQDAGKLNDLKAGIIQTFVMAPLAGGHAAASKAAPASAVESPKPTKNPFSVNSEEGAGHYVTDPMGNQVGEMFKTKEEAQKHADELHAISQVQAIKNAPLSDEAKKHIEDQKSVAGNATITTTDSIPESENPFAGGSGGIATIDRGNNRIVLNTHAFNQWLDSITPARRGDAVKAVLAEESIHLGVDDASAKSYWDNLTGIEKWAVKKRYDPNGQFSGMGDTLWGHEAVRFRLQQLARMTPTEIAQEYGGKGATSKRLTFQAITALESAVRSSREAIGTNASKEQSAILDRVQGNLEIAKAAAAGAANPFAPGREHWKDEADKLDEAAKEWEKSGDQAGADEMRAMAKSLRQKSEEQFFPEAKGRKKNEDPNQQVFAALDSRSKFEQMRMAAAQASGNGPLWRQNQRDLFNQAQAESGQQPLAPGRPDENIGHQQYSPEDLALYDKLKPGTFAKTIEEFNSPEYQKNWREFEAVRNKYGGMPPAQRFNPKAPGRGRPKKDRINPFDKGNLFQPSAFAAGGDIKAEAGHEIPEGQSTKLPTAPEIESGAARWVDDTFNQARSAVDAGKKTIVPKFSDFAEYMKRNFKVGPGQTEAMFQKLVTDKLRNATGEELQSMLKTFFGRDSMFGRMTVPDAEGRDVGGLKPKQATLSLDDIFGFRAEKPTAEGKMSVKPADENIANIISEAKTEKRAEAYQPTESEIQARLAQVYDANKKLNPHKETAANMSKLSADERRKLQAERAAVVRELKAEHIEGDARQRLRLKVVSMLAKKLFQPLGEDDAAVIHRKEVTPDDLWVSGADEGAASSYEPLSSVDEHNPDLPQILVDRSRRKNTDKASITRRATVLLDTKNNTVHIVSTWKNPTSGRVFFTNPALPLGEGIRLDSALSRYRLMYSMLLDQPAERLHMKFDSIKDYNEKFGDQALKDYREETSYDPESIPRDRFIDENVEGSEGVEGEGGYLQGPHRKEVEAVTGAGVSEMEKASKIPLTRSESDALNRFLDGVETPEELRQRLLSLKFGEFQQARTDYQKASAKLDGAMAKLERAKSARKEPSKVSAEDHAERVEKAQELVTKLRGELFQAASKVRQNAAVRTAVAKIANKFQEQHSGKGYETVSGSELLDMMAKDLFSVKAHAENANDFHKSAVSMLGIKPERVTGTPVEPGGRDLTMRTPPSSRRFQERPASNVAKLPPPQPQEMSPPPIEPIQTITGEQFKAIEQSVMDARQRMEAVSPQLSPWEAWGAQIEKDAADFERRIQQRQEAAQEPPKPPVGVEPSGQQRLPMAPGRSLRDTAEEAAHMIGQAGSAWMKRGEGKAELAAGYDSFGTVVRNHARRIAEGIRLPAIIRNRLNKSMMSGAMAAHATGAIRRTYQHTAASAHAFAEIEKTHPDVPLANALMTGDAKVVKDFITDNIDKFEEKDMKGRLLKLQADVMANRVDATTLRKMGIEMAAKAEKSIEKMLLEQGILTHEGAAYEFNDTAKSKLDEFEKLVHAGDIKAEELSKSRDWRDRMVAKKWIKSNAKLREGINFARAHWNDKDLRDVVTRTAKAMDAQFDAEIYNGGKLSYDDAYIPGYWSGELYNNDSVSFAPVILGKRSWRSKSFDNYYEGASVGPYLPASHDIADIVESRIRQGATRIGRDAWKNELTTILDPHTGLKAYANAVVDPNGKGFIADVKPGTHKNYVEVRVEGSRKPMFALKGSYERLLRQLVTPSAIQEWALSRFALQAGQYLKHVALVGDIFHLARITYYGASISGLKLFRGFRDVPGWAALDILPKDIDMAVERGVITADTAKWLREELPVNLNGEKSTMSRVDLSRELEKVGFNVGQISDAVYKDLLKEVPILGKYNKFLFDKYTRGLMMKSALDEYQRIQKIDPSKDTKLILRRVGHDLNNYFGSIGKQGWVKSSTFQDLLRVAFLSPQWVEGIAKKDLAIPYKVAIAIGRGPEGMKELLSGQETAARGIARGLIGMIVLTQAINLITRKKPTWENDEPDHKFDAFIPGGEGVFLSPLAVFNEMTHDFIRYNEVNHNAWQSIERIGENKLGFMGRAALIAIKQKTGMGEAITSTGGIAKNMAAAMLPVPLTAGAPIESGLYQATGGNVGRFHEQSQVTRSILSLIGFKAEAARKLEQSMGLEAAQFVKDNNLKTDSAVFTPTEDPSYSKLRRAISGGDAIGAKKMMDDLRETGRTDGDIIKAMKMWETLPFTGSRRNELIWLHSMTPEQRERYKQAIVAKRDLYMKWVNFYTAERAASTPAR